MIRPFISGVVIERKKRHTKSKLKIIKSIQFDVGKFSGVLGLSDDFYTFKSFVSPVYENNHLDKKEKDFVI